MFDPKPMKNATMLVAADDYAAEVSSWEFKNAGGKPVTWKGSKPNAKYTDSTPSDYTCDITGAQDWDEVDSLCNYLLEHEGETVAVEFAPNTGGAKFTASVTLVAPSIGGAADAFHEFSVSMASTKPVRVAAV